MERAVNRFITMPELSPITGKIDPLIEPLVLLLRDRGIDTIGCCQGGEGHTNKDAYIKGYLHSLKQVETIHKTLAEQLEFGCLCNGCSDFYIDAKLNADAGGIHKGEPRFVFVVQFFKPIESYLIPLMKFEPSEDSKVAAAYRRTRSV
jgi:hypothetical protein